MAVVYVDVVAENGATDVSGLRLCKPGTNNPIEQSWHIVSEAGLPAIYAGRQRLRTTLVSMEVRDGQDVMTLQITTE